MKKSYYILALSCLFGQSASSQSFKSFIGGSAPQGEVTLTSSSITPTGDTYMFGYYRSSFTIGNITKLREPNNTSSNQSFLAFVNKDNEVERLKNFNQDVNSGRLIVTDNNNDLIMGQNESVIILDADTVKKKLSNKSVIISKFDKNLNLKFAIEFESSPTNTGSISPIKIEIDKNNNIYALLVVNGGGTNTFSDSVKIGNFKFLPDNINLIKFSANGEVLWHKPMYIYNGNWDAFSVNPDGEIFLGGRMNFLRANNSFIDFGNNVKVTNNTLTNNYFDVFYAKFNTNGLPVWAKCTGKSYDGLATVSGSETKLPIIKKFIFDNGKNVFIHGNFSTAVYFGNDTLKGFNIPNPYLVKLKANGEYVWSKTVKITGSWSRPYESFDQISFDNQNNFYVVMPYASSWWQFGDTLFNKLSSSGSPNQMICKLDTNFKLLWYRYLGSRKNNRNMWSLKIIDNVIHFVNDGGLQLQYFKDYMVSGGVTYTNLQFDLDAQGKTIGTPYILRLNADNNLVTSLNEESLSIENILFPNPTSDKLYINSNSNTYTIYNSLGLEIQKGAVSGNSINVSQIDNGIYHLQLSGKESRMKFIKQ